MPVLAIGPFGLGPFELILILAIVIIIFGVGRLPEVGGAVGKGIREFRRASKEEDPKQLTEAQSSATPSGEASPVAPAPGTCAKCGTVNPVENRHCGNCGAPL